MSLTSTPCKTLEQIIYHRLITHFEQNNIFFDSQHGFRKRRGCDTQLLILIDELASALDQRKQIDLVIMDSFKVFVNVPHQRLLLKLQQHGLESSILGWIECFLTQHSQRVVLEGVKSVEVLVTCGVPQGTVLGPLLSFIFINDIHYNTNSCMRLFADDCLMYRINSPVDRLELQKHVSLLC